MSPPRRAVLRTLATAAALALLAGTAGCGGDAEPAAVRPPSCATRARSAR